MENVMKYKDIRLVSTEFQHERYTSKQEMKRFHILSDDLICLELTKTKVLLNKPIASGYVIQIN